MISVDLRGFNTSRVKNMSAIFSGCKFLTELDLSGFNTSNVTNMSNMLVGCGKLKGPNLSSFDIFSGDDRVETRQHFLLTRGNPLFRCVAAQPDRYDSAVGESERFDYSGILYR